MKVNTKKQKMKVIPSNIKDVEFATDWAIPTSPTEPIESTVPMPPSPGVVIFFLGQEIIEQCSWPPVEL